MRGRAGFWLGGGVWFLVLFWAGFFVGVFVLFCGGFWGFFVVFTPVLWVNTSKKPSH